jgi:hypothetical protein
VSTRPAQREVGHRARAASNSERVTEVRLPVCEELVVHPRQHEGGLPSDAMVIQVLVCNAPITCLAPTGQHSRRFGCEIASVLRPQSDEPDDRLECADRPGVACGYRPIAKASNRARILTGLEGVLHPLAEREAFELALC